MGVGLLEYNVGKYNYETLDVCGDFKGMKFDVVLGNPPYSIPIEGDGRTAGTKLRLYATFFDTFFNSAPYYGIVLPSNWIGRQSDSVRQNVMNDPKVKWVYDVSHYFNNMIKGTPTCVVIKDQQHNSTVKHTYGLLGEVTIEAIRLVSFDVANYNEILLKFPTNINMGSLWRRNVNTGVTRSCKILTTEVTPYPVILVTGNKNLPPETSFISEPVKQKNVDSYKVITNCNASRKSIGNIKIVEPGYYTTDSIVFFPTDDINTANNIKMYLYSKIVQFIVKVVRTSHGNSQTFFRNVPQVDFSRSWTDQELYTQFNLTQDEINLIESTIK